MTKRWFPALLVLALPPLPAAAQEVTFGGQVRPRYEFRDPRDGRSDDFVSMRVRAALRAALPGGHRVFVQLQDVRLWGEEASTLGDFRADNFDLHQGYVEVGLPGGGVSVRVGRQEAAFGGERLLGAVNWTQQGRSFDGLRVTARAEGWTVDLLGFRLAEETAEAHAEGADLLGAYARLPGLGGGDLDLYALHNRATGLRRTAQQTVGARYAASRGRLSYRFEGSYQFGERAGRDVTAYMFGARLGLSLAGGKAGLTLWADHLSGDDDPSDDEDRVFDTLFATNHKFYGFADLFLNIPRDTRGRGLRDLAVKGTVAAGGGLRLNGDLHFFRLARKAGLATDRLGEELDLTASYRLSPGVTLLAGFSYVFQGSALAALGRLDEDLRFAYLMLNAAF